ncbi:LolA family protein [Caldimonas sp. KR1-144]|uniref:LolA family protein n=1 Tax=Caldimonas sp. KR1-144 TaxID=3400911 RepID=UPI003C085961
MMPARRGALLFLIVMPLAVGAARAGSLIEGLQERLSGQGPALRGDFEQQRQLRGARQPLVSRGEFLIVRERGVLWRTREPVASALVVTPQALRVMGEDGRLLRQLDAQRLPGLREFTQLMLGLLAGDLGPLTSQFRIDGSLNGAHGWTLVLEPLSGAVASQMARIRVEGDRYVQQVIIEESAGDQTVIRFSSQRAGEASAVERTLLDPKGA